MQISCCSCQTNSSLRYNNNITEWSEKPTDIICIDRANVTEICVFILFFIYTGWLADLRIRILKIRRLSFKINIFWHVKYVFHQFKKFWKLLFFINDWFHLKRLRKSNFSTCTGALIHPYCGLYIPHFDISPQGPSQGVGTGSVVCLSKASLLWSFIDCLVFVANREWLRRKLR